MKKKRCCRGAVLALALLWGASVSAAEFPTKSMEWLAPFGPGAPSAISLKIVGDAVSKTLGQPVLNVPAPGAGGMVAGARTARAKPDGYTLLGANSATNATIFYIKKDVPYKNSDFEFLAEYGAFDLGLIVKADSPFKTLEDYIEFVRKNPNALKQASTGVGTSGHLCLELLKIKAGGLKIDMVPFKTTFELRTSVLGGHTNASFVYGGGGGSGDEFKQVLEGGGRILAVTTQKRLTAYPDVPTFVEKGLPVVFSAWYGIAGPKGMPREVSQKLKDAIYKALKDPQIVQAIEGLGYRFEFRNSEEFTAFVKGYEELVKNIVKEANIPAQ